ncbi:UDP-N-acetylglucosamine transferase subunit [Saxophila tyrrhenica]|uniref:UDP-N-acetylglucosamine transferase subunit ALG14 n=1 Tax=Saxophila tyrrhenica TaxID=1690608 RepID=A0AAV9PD15_9PEZI|nr:UDP-N-acetylglucosamine transferase subunit [Saxophila tyrrhenica]
MASASSVRFTLTYLIFAFTCFLAIVSLILVRLSIILSPHRLKPSELNRAGSAHLLIVLGSGGHTAEMVAMLERAVNEDETTRRFEWKRFKHRTWVVSSGDSISAQRARAFEDMASGNGTTASGSQRQRAQILTVPRAREIHQPIYTAPISSLRCLFATFGLLLGCSRSGRDFPDIILCNGPATATIIVFTAVLLRFFNVRNCHSRGKMRTVYVESWARVKKLSLSGNLLEGVADRFVVQWPQLAKGGRGSREFLGVLV